MKLELVDPEELRLALRLNELLAVDGILLLQPLHVDLFDDVLSKTSNLCNGFVRQAVCKQISGIVLQLTSDVMVFGLKEDSLHLTVAAGGAVVPRLLEADAAQLAAEV